MGIYKDHNIKTLADLRRVTRRHPFWMARELRRQKQGRGQMKPAGVYTQEVELGNDGLTFREITAKQLLAYMKGKMSRTAHDSDCQRGEFDDDKVKIELIIRQPNDKG